MTAKYTLRQIFHLTELKKSGLSDEEIMSGLKEVDDLVTETFNALTFPSHSSNSGKPVPKPRNPDTTTTTSTAMPEVSTLKRKAMPLADSSSSPHLSQPPARMPRLTMPASMSQEMMSLRGSPRQQYSSGPVIPMQRIAKGFDMNELKLIDSEVIDLLHRDVHSVRGELQEFMAKYKIKQATIVRMMNNRMSQAYISSWLLKPHAKNFRKVLQLYEWYVSFRRQVTSTGANRKVQTPPKKIPAVDTSRWSPKKLSSPAVIETSSWSPPAPTSLNVSSSPTQNGEEEVTYKEATTSELWPTVCESYLQREFDMNPHPNYNKRKEIAAQCSVVVRAFERQRGYSGADRQEVTTNQVCVWYISKRKENTFKRNSMLHLSNSSINSILSPSLNHSSVKPSQKVEVPSTDEEDNN